MMKLSASPGRPDNKFPPPLVRFMKSNVGSRSRGRSRSSPMFLRRKVTASGEEPTSPKVTCMGQVRTNKPKTRPNNPTRRRCKWARKALSCGGKLVDCSLKQNLGKWVLFFRVRKPEKSRDCPEIEEPRQRVGYEVEDEEAEVSVSVSSSSVMNPPINALLLTRSRSAPYRSSSLASKFWGSPLRSDETEEQEREKSKTEQFSGDDSGDGERHKPTSESESISGKSGRNSRIDAETDEKSGFFGEFEGSIATKLKTGEFSGAGDGRRQSPTSETDSIPGKSDKNPKADAENDEKSRFFEEFETGEFSGAGDDFRAKPTSEIGSICRKSDQNPKTENGEKPGFSREFETGEFSGAGGVTGDDFKPKPTSETGSIRRKSDQYPKTDTENDEKPGFSGEFETGEPAGAGGVAGDGHRPKPTSETGSINRKTGRKPRTGPENDENSGIFGEFEAVGAMHPLLLTRCKSEPARIAGEKLSPEMGLWRLRRFGVL